jgi:hypothetical protein
MRSDLDQFDRADEPSTHSRSTSCLPQLARVLFERLSGLTRTRARGKNDIKCRHGLGKPRAHLEMSDEMLAGSQVGDEAPTEESPRVGRRKLLDAEPIDISSPLEKVQGEKRHRPIDEPDLAQELVTPCAD